MSYVVVYGARERDLPGDEQIVNDLLTHLSKLYGSALVIISAATDKGIGRYVKDRCLSEKERFKFIDVSTKIFGEIPPARLAQVFKCRNATLAELGTRFYVLDTVAGKGITEDLIVRARNAGSPVYVYKPGDTQPKRVPPLAPEPGASVPAKVSEAQERDI